MKITNFKCHYAFLVAGFIGIAFVAKAQELPRKSSAALAIQNALANPFNTSTTNTTKDTLSISKGLQFPANIETGYTVEVDARVTSTSGRGLDVFTRSQNSKGAILTISGNGMLDFGENKILAKLLAGNASANTYRIAVTAGIVYFYRNGALVGTSVTHNFPKENTQVSTTNLFPDGGFEAAIAKSGFGMPAGEWGTFPAGRLGYGGGNKYSRIDSLGGWQTEGGKFLFVRMRNNGNTNEAAGAAESSDLENLSCRMLYYRATGLTANRTYTLKFKYKGHNLFQKTVSVFATSAVSETTTTTDALGTVATMEAETAGSTGTTSAVKDASMSFTVPANQTEVYIVFKRNGNANFYIDNVSLIEDAVDVNVDKAELAIGKFTQTLGDMGVTAVRYDLTGAYAPELITAEQCLSPLYTDKVNLIKDPGFNQGFAVSKDLTFATASGQYVGWGTIAINTDPAFAFCGNNSGKINNGSGSIDLNLQLKTYTKYRMKAMIKTMDGSFQIGIAKYDGASADINQVINTNGQWQALDFEFKTGSDVTGALTFFNNWQRTGKTAYIDNWELYEIGVVEGVDVVITADQMPETAVKQTIREMLAKHLPYAEGKFAAGGYFGTGNSDEHGARTNADYALIYSFIHKYAQDQNLPGGLSFETVKQHALSAIRYSYRTHKTGTQNCANGSKWGLVWESSMWCTSTAFASWMMWNELTDADKAAVKAMVIAEANFNLGRTIPTAINSDTKAEENGWDTNILAIASAMFPDEKNAEAWTLRCKQFAMNTYSVGSDLYNKKIVDGKYVRDWHIGANLFPDYALENHDFFHTSYLNIPIQEMSESLLAYKAVQDQNNPTFPVPDALKHNVPEVWNTMLKSLIMADGELAMPNGNDWSMYIYDQLSTYAAMACIYRDPDALMLESITLQYAKMRQTTTSDGGFMLKPDVTERRMAVTGRRLVFAHLYHEFFPTNGMVATNWDDFSKKTEVTKFLPYSRIIRSNTADRFVTFSWFQSNSLSYKSYMGMVSPNLVDKSNIVFPLKVANTGNLTGYADVTSKARNASLIGETYLMYPNSFTTTGKLNVDDSSLTQYIGFYSTPGNVVIYQDELVGNVAGTMTKEGGLMLGITTDIISRLSRTLYSQNGSVSSNGSTVSSIAGNWVNVDNVLGMVVNGGSGIAFGEKEEKTSVMVSKLYGSYSTTSKSFAAGDLVSSRSAAIYSRVNSATTQLLATKAQYPTVAAGWKATAAEDPDGRRYLLMSNFRSTTNSDVSLSYPEGAPVFDRVTTISNQTGTATFNTTANVSTPQELYAFVSTGTATIEAVQGETPNTVYVLNENPDMVSTTVSIWNNNGYINTVASLAPNECKLFQVNNNTVTATVGTFPGGYRNISRGKHIYADDQWPEHFPFATIDDMDSTYYQSLKLPTSSAPQNLTLRLWGLYACNRLIIKANEGNGPRDILIQSSNDGTTFTTVHSTSLANSVTNQVVDFPESDARFLRIKINSSYGAENVGIKSIQFFGFPK